MADKQKCMIIGAVPIKKSIFSQFNLAEYYIICADAGYKSALKCGIAPDLIVGDFDSAPKPPDGLKCIFLPVEKDVTDSMFAAQEALKMGFKDFVFLGCLGGKRLDHSIANFEVLKFLDDKGANAYILDYNTSIILINERRLRITESKGYTVSVFPYAGMSCNVSYEGLEYPLIRKTLTIGSIPMGISNCIVEETAEITVHAGIAIIILTKP